MVARRNRAAYLRHAARRAARTVRTASHQFEHMHIDFVTRLALQAGNQRREVAILELFRSAAIRTNEMVRVSLPRRDIAVAAIAKVNALNVAIFCQQVEGAIDGDQSEMRIFFARACFRTFAIVSCTIRIT